MPVVITKVTGIGGTPPTQLLVEGWVTGCEFVWVRSKCATAPSLPIDTFGLPTNAAGQKLWSAVLTSLLGPDCDCGQIIEIDATCVLGFPSGSYTTFTLPITCADCCDEVVIATQTPLPCLPLGGGPVTVQFSATLLPTGCTANAFEWKVTDAANNVIQPFTPGSSTFSFAFPTAGTYKVNVRVQQSMDCDDPVLTHSVMFTLDNCTPCVVTLTGPQTTPCTDGPPTAAQTFTASTTPAFAGPFSWEVEGPTGATVHQSTGGVTFNYSFPGPGMYTVKVSLVTRGCTNATASDSITVNVPPCTPPTTPTPTTTTPTPTTTTPTPTPTTTPPPTTTAPPTTTTSTGGFDFCCFLIWWWGISHWVAGSLLYFGFWIAGIICSAVATILLVIWMAACCANCFRFGRCCPLFGWVAMFNDVLVITLFGLYAVGVSGVAWVLLAFGLVSTIVRIAMSAGGCGAIPNIFAPSTWPPCRCP